MNVDHQDEEMRPSTFISSRWRSDLRWDMDDQLDETLKYHHLKALLKIYLFLLTFKQCSM